MRIVKILGGLGNQMFQYALALSLSHRYKDEIIKIDTSCFNGYPLHEGFELSRIFNITLKSATFNELAKIAYPYMHYRVWQIGSRILPKRQGMLTQLIDKKFESKVFDCHYKYYDGYWQSEKYFEDCIDVIRNQFKFKSFENPKNIELANRLDTGISVSVHIRRGDYLKHALYRDICSENYYKKAISFIKSKTYVDNFILFSNDMDWCLNHSKELFGNTTIIPVTWNTGKDSYRDMHLMSLCSHNIIANSSFSWWGAWLNHSTKKIVITPSKWVNGNLNLDTIPTSWIKL